MTQISSGARLAVLAARIAIAASLVFAAYYCLVFARASYLYGQDTATSIPAAFALVPFNANYASRLGAWQPARKEQLLQTAVVLNPFDVDSWIQLGMYAELEKGDVRAAEGYYLRAADVDKMFRPKWTLTNFYFRQQRPTEFFRWAEATLEITPYQAEPIFVQMWLMSQDAAKVSAFIPDRPAILVQYALYLAKQHQYSAIPADMRRLERLVNARDAHAYGRDDLIGPMLDRLLVAGQGEPALNIWNSLVQARWLAYPSLPNENPITNGDFRQPFFGHGFDWAIQNANGTSISQNPEEGFVRITLTGDEPERVVLLRQFIPLEPEQDYHLGWRAEGEGISAPSGFAWHVYPLEKSAALDQRSEDLLSAGSPGWTFRSSASAHLAMLDLEYARPTGSTRAEGSVVIRSVSLKKNADLHEKK
jgi:tetratricopeptide (TPR) repeat protein